MDRRKLRWRRRCEPRRPTCIHIPVKQFYESASRFTGPPLFRWMNEAVEWWPSRLATAFCYYPPPPSPFFFFISSFLQYLQQKDNIVTEKKEEKKLLAITFSPGDSGQGELSRRGRGCCGGGDVVRGDISAISNRFERKKEIKKERIPERAINQAWKLPLYYSRVKL